jgi:hypothetical protein
MSTIKVTKSVFWADINEKYGFLKVCEDFCNALKMIAYPTFLRHCEMGGWIFKIACELKLHNLGQNKTMA